MLDLHALMDSTCLFLPAILKSASTPSMHVFTPGCVCVRSTSSFVWFWICMQTVAHTDSSALAFPLHPNSSDESRIHLWQGGGAPLLEMLLMSWSPGEVGSWDVCVFISAGERWCPRLLCTLHSPPQLAKLHQHLLAQRTFCQSGGCEITFPRCFSLYFPNYCAASHPALYLLAFWVSSSVNCFFVSGSSFSWVFGFSLADFFYFFVIWKSVLLWSNTL